MRFILPIFLSFSFVFAEFSCDDALSDKQRFFSQNLTATATITMQLKQKALHLDHGEPQERRHLAQGCK